MGRRKVRKEAEEAQTLADEIGENGEEGGGKGTGFFACYLLTSLCPRFKGHTYIGYTLNPRRRIRQHNGEIGSGAWRTKRKRPWEMVLCIYGFPTNIAALQFEWAWQHPVESLAVRNAATSFKSLSGLANKIKLAYTMLSLPTWQSLNLTVNLFSTKYQKYTSACPALPDQMCTQIGSMDELPCYNVNACVNDESDDTEFQEKESTEAAMEAHDSPSFVYSHEEDVDQQFNYGDDAGTESSECLASTQVGWPRNSLPIREEDRGQSSSIMYNSPAKPFANSYVFEDPESPRSVELTTELDGPPNKRSTTASVCNEDQPYSRSPVISHCDVVEIIDIFTPPPHCPINSGMKKRRLLDMSPEIIDLTNSPMYV